MEMWYSDAFLALFQCFQNPDGNNNSQRIIRNLLVSFGFGLWHPSKVLRINFGSCKILVFGSCPKYFYHGFPGIIELQVLFLRKILSGNSTEFPSFHNGRKVQSEMLSFKWVTIKIGICSR